MPPTLLTTDLPGLPARRGKVRDVYDLGDGRLLVVATDRISAFDWVLPTGIPDKGRVLTALSAHWFRSGLVGANHLISTEIDDAGLALDAETRESLAGRSMIVKRADVFPFECVVRGYLVGSGWKDYRANGAVCGVDLPPGHAEADAVGPLFTPATKAESGHDMNVSFFDMANALGHETAEELRRLSLSAYTRANEAASTVGLILADTKFEFGRDPKTGQILMVDEALTPDSSRYWPAEGYAPGRPQPSFDKQFVRDWLEASGWDKSSPPPALPDEVVAATRDKYIQAYELISGHPFPRK